MSTHHRGVINTTPFICGLLSGALLASVGCRRADTSHDHIISQILAHRDKVDSSFRFDPESPFASDTNIHFDGLKWFPPDVSYYFESKLYQNAKPETITVYGTKGEPRIMLKYGHFMLEFEGKLHKLHVYKFTQDDPEQYALYRNQLSVWFTDETTGKETYEVGRYVDVGEENPDSGFIYAVNLNNAYNPYCAYSSIYTCAIPTKDDHLSFPVRAGEMKYHP